MAIYFKYPNADSPTNTLTFTSHPSYPTPAQPVLPAVRVETMGGTPYISQKGPVRNKTTLVFRHLADGDATTDYEGLLNFFKTIVLGKRRAFDYVDADSNVLTVRFSNDPQGGNWQRNWHNNCSATVELIEEV